MTARQIEDDGPADARTLVAAMFAVIDGRRWDELPSFFAEGIVYDRPGYATFTGLGELSTFYREQRNVRSGRHHLVTLLADGAEALCWGWFTGVDLGGRPLHEAFADHYAFDDQGLAVARRTFFYRPAL
ncbi:nuclear transport factor 2 family protein [Actinomycetospora sp. CA-053990]|uniref:nuclear transport factor 2 family protein n=1 Tax=Actinomycetospora sp. CA-053990 TaxID=3239891 RepID=UPI003D937D88